MSQIEFPGLRDRVRACVPDAVVRGEDQCVDGRGSPDQPRSWPDGALIDERVENRTWLVGSAPPADTRPYPQGLAGQSEIRQQVVGEDSAPLYDKARADPGNPWQRRASA